MIKSSHKSSKLVSPIQPESIVGLVATRPSLDLLSIRSVPSIRAQTKPPSLLLVVFDKRPPRVDELICLRQMAFPVQVVLLHNQQNPGAAGCWNTGINWTTRHHPASYIAILDDDDTWDESHLEICWKVAEQQQWPDIVLSGLKRHMDGKLLVDNLPNRLTSRDFLTGNPGWQGSNTFIKAQTLARIGGFTAGLSSCNDRDLAIRLLESPGIKLAFTGFHTATWYCNERQDALSAPGSLEKLDGLAHFLLLHRHRMDLAQQQAFFQRAEKLFRFTQAQILHRMATLPLTRNVDDGLLQPSPQAGPRNPLPPSFDRDQPDSGLP